MTTFDATMDWNEEIEHGFSVVLPLDLQVGFGRIFAAAELESDLEAVGPDVIKVLHSTCSIQTMNLLLKLLLVKNVGHAPARSYQ